MALKTTRANLRQKSGMNWQNGLMGLGMGAGMAMASGGGVGGAVWRGVGLTLAGMGGMMALRGYGEARRASRLDRISNHMAGQKKRAGLKKKAAAAKKPGGTGVVKAHSRRQGTKTVQIKQRTQSAAERSARMKAR